MVSLPGLTLPSAAVTVEGPVTVDVELEAQGAEVLLTGEVRFEWQGDCRRCLEVTHGQERVELREVFERAPVEGETWPLGTDHVDLEPVVREAVLLTLPLVPLCSPDCRGPAPERFPATVEGTDENDAGGGPVDPRWAALDQLHFD